MFFYAKSVHNDSSDKDSARKIAKNFRPKFHFGSKKCKSRQPIDCTFWSNFSKKGQIKQFFSAKSVHNDALI